MNDLEIIEKFESDIKNASTESEFQEFAKEHAKHIVDLIDKATKKPNIEWSSFILISAIVELTRRNINYAMFILLELIEMGVSRQIKSDEASGQIVTYIMRQIDGYIREWETLKRIERIENKISSMLVGWQINTCDTEDEISTQIIEQAKRNRKERQSLK